MFKKEKMVHLLSYLYSFYQDLKSAGGRGDGWILLRGQTFFFKL